LEAILIEIEAILDEGGVLRSCKASGHANAGRKGTDIVCAAVSVLMRTAFRVLSGRKGITVRCDAPEEGFLFLEADYLAEGREFLYATGVFLTEGLASVAEEYPQYCNFELKQTRRT
jgi:uncharacterized protein YsxB (DUF464 family)